MTWRLEAVTVTFGKTTALADVSMTILPGQIHAVVGGDGAGKSTLMRILAGLDLGQSGRIALPDQRDIGFVPSSGGVFGDLTVTENMRFVADTYRLDDWRARADGLLAAAELSDAGDRLANQLSGGMRRKLAGSMALLPVPRLLVLDEVTTGVDPISRMELWRLVAGAAAGGTAVVAATSYLDEAERASQVTLLHDGHVLASGTPEEIITGIPGAVVSCDEPSDIEHAWRRGRRWRQWISTSATDSEAAADDPTSLEDAAIVHELLAGGPS